MYEKERCSICGKIPQGITMHKSELLAFLSSSTPAFAGEDFLYCSLTCLKASLDKVWSKNVDTWCLRRKEAASAKFSDPNNLRLVK
jgi:hypothetical protein